MRIFDRGHKTSLICTSEDTRSSAENYISITANFLNMPAILGICFFITLYAASLGSLWRWRGWTLRT